MTYFNPTVPTIPNPVNADTYINLLQTALSGISWIEYSFGRTTRHSEKGKIYPKTYQTSKEYQIVMPNDNLGKGYSFIEVDSAEPEFNLDQQSIWEYGISVICYANYNKIDSTKDYPFVEELLQDVMVVFIDETILCEIIPNKIFFEVEEIFRDYTLDIINSQYLIFPWGGFRIDATMKFIGDCP